MKLTSSVDARRHARRFLPFLSLFCLMAAGTSHASGVEPASASTLSTDMVLLVVYVLLALFLSFLCSVAEAVLLSITPSYVANLEGTDPERAQDLKQLRGENIDRSLAGILTLNTIAHTAGAIGAGAQASLVFGSTGVGIFSAVMTLMILFLSEIVPKTLGALYWRNLTGFAIVFVNFLTKALYPLIWVSEKLTKLISRGQEVHVFSRDEFVAMATVGQESGHINDQESRIISNLFRFGTLMAKDIMTPRTVVMALPESATVADALQIPMTVPFTRLPIYGKDLDEVTGFVLREDLYAARDRGQEHQPVVSLKREMLAIPGMITLSSLLETLLNRRQHIALVVGEYGETRGVVTLEDLLETLLGIEIVDEGDRVPDMQHMARQLWERRARSLGIELEPHALTANDGPVKPNA